MTNLSLNACRSYLDAHTRMGATEEHRDLPVVTMSREAGAGGVTVAQLLADLLNGSSSKRNGCPWTIFDRNLIERVLADHQLPKEIARYMPEDAAAFSAGAAVEELLGLHPSSWTLVQHTTDTILHLARMGNVILVGRGSNIIAGQCRNAFHVRLVAPLELRIQRMAELNHLTQAEAARLVRKTDLARRRYVQIHFKADIDDPLRYHAVFNTGLMSLETVAKGIANAI